MRFICLVLALVCVALPVSAQTVVVGPTILEFTPSADHNLFRLDGVTPIVTYYELRVYKEAEPTVPVKTISLGKPTPNGQNKIIVDVVPLLADLTKGVRHLARVAAVGAGFGTGLSDPAPSPFGFERTDPIVAVTGVVIR